MLEVENYGIWKFQIRITLIDCGLCDCIDGTEPVDSSRDQTAYAKICFCIQTVCYPHVRNAKMAKEAWNNLKTAYENQGISRRLAIKRRLFRIHHENFESMDLYFGEIISEVMLAGLPDEFNPLFMGFEGTQMKLTSEFVKTRLMQGDYHRSKGGISGSKETAYAARKRRVYLYQSIIIATRKAI
jgi:hypothetical protein